MTLDQIDRVSEGGQFVQAELALSDRATITLGGRYDRLRFELDDAFLSDGDQSGVRVLEALSGTAGVSARLSDGVRPYASVSTAFESPTTTEFVNRPDGQPGLNPELEPQRTWQLEAGVRGRVGTGFEYSIAAFHADVDDELIPFESPVDPQRVVFRNAGSARHQGFETGVTLRSPSGWTLVGAYTFADYRFDEFRTATEVLDDNRIPGVPLHQLHASLRYRDVSGVWGALDNTYNSSVYADDANTGTADAWWVTSVRVGMERELEGWRFAPFISVQNVLDERYAGSVVVNARGGRYFEPAPGRHLVVGLEFGR